MFKRLGNVCTRLVPLKEASKKKHEAIICICTVHSAHVAYLSYIDSTYTCY